MFMLTVEEEVIRVLGGTCISPFIHARDPELEQRSNPSATNPVTFIGGVNKETTTDPILQATSTSEQSSALPRLHHPGWSAADSTSPQN